MATMSIQNNNQMEDDDPFSQTSPDDNYDTDDFKAAATSNRYSENETVNRTSTRPRTKNTTLTSTIEQMPATTMLRTDQYLF